MSLPNITIFGEKLGALFAATDKPNYDGVDRVGDARAVAVALAHALRTDAENFCDLLDDGSIDPDDLVRDFLRR